METPHPGNQSKVAYLRDPSLDQSCSPIFINDCPKRVNGNISLYADDTKLFITTNNGIDLQDDLDNLQTWAQEMQMLFHPDKCKVMHLGHNNQHKEYRMKKNDGSEHVLDSTTAEKDLGVTVDDKLTFNTHVHNSINKANKMLGILRRTFTVIDRDIFLPLYKCMVRPHIEYATWAPTAIGLRDKIERV
jgi:ribonuclease P/MRP protein subunit RPP40